MVLSLFVYTFSAIILYLLGRNIALRETRYMATYHKASPFWSSEMILIIILFAFISGARYQVGQDHLTYLTNYLDMQKQGWTTRETFESGFTFLMKLFTNLGLHFFFFFAFLGCLQIFFFYYAFKKEKYLYPYFGPIIMLTPLFLTWMNGIRQSIVCCIFVFLVQFIKERKLLYYFIGIVIAATIHKSAYLLLPLYFIFWKDFYFKNKYFNILTVVFCTILGSSPTWSHLIQNTQSLFALLGYDNYNENIDTIMEDTRKMNWGPIRILLYLTNICIIWYYPKVRKRFSHHKMLDLYFTFFFIGASLYNLLVETGIIFTRPLMYFTIFTYVMLAYTLKGLSLISKKNFYFFSLITFGYIYFELFKLNLTNTIFSPEYYKFFFLEQAFY